MNRELQEVLHAGSFTTFLYAYPDWPGMYGIALASKHYNRPECVSHFVVYNIKIDWDKNTEEVDAHEQLPGNLACAVEYTLRLSAEDARAGICCKYTGVTLTRWFERFPELQQHTRANYSTDPDQFTNTSALFAELMKQHHTPHVDEILAQRAVTELLPQPIAEAIVECMRGVILRRWCVSYKGVNKYYAWNTFDAWCDEVRFTYIDMYGETRQVRRLAAWVVREQFPIRGHIHTFPWEEAAAAIHADW